ncbi:multidrug ABC transporter ATP-binding protein [Arthrobacter sp. MYb227]|uniref:ATP-binding cassette domain-containing protein n=1 Tax=Arthrobacter sp. MYb227 TaxID=1848601 RepID=UPI000CFDF78E|nr:ATP-binding cassette domain-containing protein [Arthrobacter sp. MYb227]PQZ92194.1 multidrug ABC transporter ATP-binding protein [Arthrobacter sp. MYb227]
MIIFQDLGKDYGSVRAVDSLSLSVMPGKVTGFLGPNGAGKTTTMRMLLGLDSPSRGSATINGVGYAQLLAPLRTVGALLEPRTGHRGQRADSHLTGLARSNKIPVVRVQQVLEEVGLGDTGKRRIGTFSLGMRQRLGIAAALLGDPEILIFDEPVNGLDADGVAWIRGLMRAKAAAGATVFVSSHLMSEMQSTADQLVVIGRGKLLAHDSMDHVLASSAQNSVVVSSPHIGILAGALEKAGFTVAMSGIESLQVTAATPTLVGGIAHELGLRINELSLQRASLEQAYTELTAQSLDYVPTGIVEES